MLVMLVMLVDMDGKRSQACKHLLANLLVVDQNPIILFHHYYHFQHIYGVNAELSAHQAGVRIKTFRSQLRQIQQADQLPF